VALAGKITGLQVEGMIVLADFDARTFVPFYLPESLQVIYWCACKAIRAAVFFQPYPINDFQRLLSKNQGRQGYSLLKKAKVSKKRV
jgi:hypothetical protein